jgi:hypothetical protein
VALREAHCVGELLGKQPANLAFPEFFERDAGGSIPRRRLFDMPLARRIVEDESPAPGWIEVNRVPLHWGSLLESQVWNSRRRLGWAAILGGLVRRAEDRL